MKKLLLFGMWWIMIFSASGETSIMEFRTKSECETIRAAYERSAVKVTSCIWKESEISKTPL